MCCVVRLQTGNLDNDLKENCLKHIAVFLFTLLLYLISDILFVKCLSS